MSVLKPRNRLVNFRLSEEEFQAMSCACERSGARSLSDFARGAVLRSIEQNSESCEPKAVLLERLESLVESLEARLGNGTVAAHGAMEVSN